MCEGWGLFGCPRKGVESFVNSSIRFTDEKNHKKKGVRGVRPFVNSSIRPTEERLEERKGG